ncbi:hypothetical protein BpHYR1_002565 [Brachionus plicatilis]|uniref:Uncharacterized protein n=1 Tax=Brachionus plicatilis TaxID=10195 RepID=A0A3M7RGA8_BRAPC|nr:hypothetical protein BpHYR1_002565 [Brachionus plicatilis]
MSFSFIPIGLVLSSLVNSTVQFSNLLHKFIWLSLSIVAELRKCFSRRFISVFMHQTIYSLGLKLFQKIEFFLQVPLILKHRILSDYFFDIKNSIYFEKNFQNKNKFILLQKISSLKLCVSIAYLKAEF